MFDYFFIILVIIISLVFAVIGTLIFRKKFGHEHLSKHNDVAGFIFAVIGVNYAVLMAFVVLVVWEEFQDANLSIEKEANTISAMIALSEGFSENYKNELKVGIKEYLNVVVKSDWDIMSNNSSLNQIAIKPSDNSFNKLRKTVYSYITYDAKEAVLFAKLTDNIESLASDRRTRFASTKNVVPNFMWFVLIIGGLIVLLFSMLFSSVNLWAQLIMISSLSISISLVLLLIYALNHPYTGIITLDPDSFKLLLKTI